MKIVIESPGKLSENDLEDIFGAWNRKENDMY